MIRHFCDYCIAELEDPYRGGNSVFEQEMFIEGGKAVLRVEVRRGTEDKKDLSRPDICGKCRTELVKRAFGLSETRASQPRMTSAQPGTPVASITEQ